MMIFVNCRLCMYVGVCMCVFLMRYVSYKHISLHLVSSAAFCISDRTGRGNHQGQISQVSPLPAENSFLFAVCRLSHTQKNPQFSQHGRSHFLVSASTEEPADGNCASEYLSGTFNTSEAFLLCCRLAVALPQFPQKKPHVQEVCDWLICCSWRNQNYLNCRVRNELELNKLPVLLF